MSHAYMIELPLSNSGFMLFSLTVCIVSCIQHSLFYHKNMQTKSVFSMEFWSKKKRRSEPMNSKRCLCVWSLPHSPSDSVKRWLRLLPQHRQSSLAFPLVNWPLRRRSGHLPLRRLTAARPAAPITIIKSAFFTPTLWLR